LNYKNTVVVVVVVAKATFKFSMRKDNKVERAIEVM
jgi:hypothetical protein